MAGQEGAPGLLGGEIHPDRHGIELSDPGRR